MTTMEQIKADAVNVAAENLHQLVLQSMNAINSVAIKQKLSKAAIAQQMLAFQFTEKLQDTIQYIIYKILDVPFQYQVHRKY